MAMERILINGVAGMIKPLVPVVTQEIGSAWGVNNHFIKLQATFDMILSVISDAENRQVEEEAVRLWLRLLKDVAYDVEDVMDDFSYQTFRRSKRDALMYKVCDFISSSNPIALRFKLAKKVKDINKKLDEVAKARSRFHLQTAPRDTVIAHGESSKQRRRQTASVPYELQLVGRDNDKDKIIKMLTTVTTSSSNNNYQGLENVSTVSIVGMGGLGKTAVAHIIFEDELVNKHFDLKIWVCVSVEFDVDNILTKAMEFITDAKFDTPSNFAVLVNKVQAKLRGKKYLLVLDDLWNEDVEQWERLKIAFVAGAQGSKILITTRKSKVADVVKGSIPPYKIEKLQEEDCWSIDEKKAFSPGGALKTPNMVIIGKEIAKKCNGLPLAAKFLGSLLRIKNTENNWLSIKENDICNSLDTSSTIMPILKLSYDNLSSNLKRCFSYCSIFPKDWEMSKENLIHLWMAEGFLEQFNVGNKTLIEDIGDKYFESLMQSSFFDGVKKNELDDVTTCKMHDLVHDLAQAVVGDTECTTWKVSDWKNVSPEVRRLRLILDTKLSLSVRNSKRMSKVLKKLRTTIVLEQSHGLNPTKISYNKHLRVLHLGPVPGTYITCVPFWWFKSRNLRYLHLSSLTFQETFIFQSKFYNLQTFVLRESVGVKYLLKNMGSLQKLRYLDISFTDIEELPDFVGNLSSLQTLVLNNCKNFKAFPDSVTGYKNLRFLDLSFTAIEKLPDFVVSLSYLETLDLISCSRLKALPECVSSLHNLTILHLKNCSLLEELPNDIGALTQLRSLNLFGTRIRVLPESCSNLRNLELVHLFWCSLPQEVESWTKLRKFYYFGKGTPMGIGKLISLQTLTLAVSERVVSDPDCNIDGIEVLRDLNSLERLSIHELQNVRDPIDAERANLKGKQNIRNLDLCWSEVEELDHKYCSLSDAVLEALQPPTNSRDLVIENFMGSGLPLWMCIPSCLPNLQFLVLSNCKEIKQFPAEIGHLPCLQYLQLSEMPLKRLDAEFPRLLDLVLGGMWLLEELSNLSVPCMGFLLINGCSRLKEMPAFSSLRRLTLQKIDPMLVSSTGRSLTSLEQLKLDDIEELIYFPISILQNNCNLQLLQIGGCNQFQGFRLNDDENENEVGLLRNGSLQQLEIVSCPVLMFLPDLHGWTSLQVLTIFKCTQLKENLTYDLKSLTFLKELLVDFIQRDEGLREPIDSRYLINLLG